MYERLIKYSINQHLSTPLSDSTEESWEDAFGAMEVLVYQSPFCTEKIHDAFNNIEERSIDFQKVLLELTYANYPSAFALQVQKLLDNTMDSKVFALCAEYLLKEKNNSIFKETITELINKKFGDQGIIDPVLYMLQLHISEEKNTKEFLSKKLLGEIFSNKFLTGQTVMYSIQRKNRDYPGLVVVRQKNGDFVTDSNGIVFHIPQLARSISGLPFYLRNGNTPQGIFQMHGFQISMSSFIGPTANVQLSMPVETSLQNFFSDSTIADTVWNIDYYKRLIPADLKNYLPLYHSYYAGLSGRTEIIAHGTTIDPNIYLHKPYFPLTPTEGCLCTKELWNGKRLESDQQKLVNALLKAGGATGYCVVIELDDKTSAVTFDEIKSFLK
ncbi:MAG: hypothetical protein M3139_19100 [Bacteroidota bacterium]|nr:hypothetical protein [Bacteroidota bacterium]